MTFNMTFTTLRTLTSSTSLASPVSTRPVTSPVSTSPSSSSSSSSSSPLPSPLSSSPLVPPHHYSFLDSGLHESRPWETQPVGELAAGLAAPARITLIAGLVFGLWMILAVAAWLSRGCLTSHTHAHAAYRQYGPPSKSLTATLRAFWQTQCARTRTDSRESLNAPIGGEQYGTLNVYNHVFAASSDDEEAGGAVAAANDDDDERRHVRRSQRAKMADWMEQQEQYLTVEVERTPASPGREARRHALPVLMITDTQTTHTDIVEEDEQAASTESRH